MELYNEKDNNLYYCNAYGYISLPSPTIGFGRLINHTSTGIVLSYDLDLLIGKGDLMRW
jgi:hypothetical protein